MLNKIIGLLKEKCYNWQNIIKPKFAGRKKYIWICVIILISIFGIIIFSQNTFIANRQKTQASTPQFIEKKLSNMQSYTVLEINTPETDNIVVVDSEKLNLDLIEEKLALKAKEVAKHAEKVQVEVYSNSNGILVAPSDNDFVQQETIATVANSDKNTTRDEDNDYLSAIEATYEEELPEGEYIESAATDVIPTDDITAQKLKKMEIAIKRKPPYFGENPVVVIVIDDMGISHKRTADISSLQAPITSSFLTYSKNLNEQIQVAQAAGHEIIMHAPMQAKSNPDIAPDVLTIDMTTAEIAANFEQMLNKFHHISGINNHMGSLFTEHAEKLAPIMDILRRRGLFFLDSKTSPKSAAKQVAKDYAVAYAHRHVFLDNTNDKNYVLKQLALTERIARRNGYAVAIGHPKHATFLALKEWLPTLEQKNIKMLPLSQVVKVLNPHISYLR